MYQEVQFQELPCYLLLISIEMYKLDLLICTVDTELSTTFSYTSIVDCSCYLCSKQRQSCDTFEQHDGAST